jgi:hypothetical protein
MKITGIDLHGSDGAKVVELSFRDPASQKPYIAKAVVGLDADEIIARFYGISQASSSKYYSLSLERRTVVIRISLNPDFETSSYSQLRDDLYKMISSSRTGKIDLRFKEGPYVIAHVAGFITKFEAPHFTETPEVQLTVECDDPMLRSMNVVYIPIATTPGTVATLVDDISTAPHGFKFNVTFTTIAPDFIIQDAATPEWQFKVTPGTIGAATGFLVGDKLYFSSEYTDKYVYMIRGGATIHLVDKVVHGSIWPIIFPGSNPFNSSPAGFTWDSVSHYPAYWGV